MKKVHPESYRRGFAPILIIICTIFLLIFIYWFFFIFSFSGFCVQVLQEARNPITGQVKTFPTPCKVPLGWQKLTQVTSSEKSLQSDPTANWKTYIGTGIQFKYPENWAEAIDGNSSKHFKLSNSNATLDLLDLYIAETGNYQEQSYSFKSQQAFGNKTPEINQINNYEVKVALIQGEPNLFYSVLITNKSKYVWLVFSAELNPESHRNLLNQILSTFKFLN